MARVACPSDASLLQHPGRRYVVETYAIINNGSCSDENPMSISMKIYEGGDMKTYFNPNNQKADKYTDCSAKTELALKIAMGLQYIHATGITHRDLHTGNILFDAEGEPAITDFGISMNGTHKLKVVSVDDPRYVAVQFFTHPPEFSQEDGSSNVISDKSDVYALGRVFEQILYDTRTVDNWQIKQWNAHTYGGWVEPIETRNGIDTRFLPIPSSTPCEKLQAVAHKCLTLHYENRPSASRVVAMLRTCGDGGEKEWSDYFEIGIEGLKNIIRGDVLVSTFFLMFLGLFCFYVPLSIIKNS